MEADELLEPFPPARVRALAVRARVHLSAGQHDLALEHAALGMDLLTVVGSVEEGEMELRRSFLEDVEAHRLVMRADGV